MSQMQVGGGGYRSSQNVPMLKCPKWPRGGGGGQKTLGQCPKVYFFFEGIPNLIKNHLICIGNYKRAFALKLFHLVLKF